MPVDTEKQGDGCVRHLLHFITFLITGQNLMFDIQKENTFALI